MTQGGQFRLSLDIAFVEKEPFGAFEGVPQRVYAKLERTYEARARSLPLSRAAAERERLYAQAARGCREIRARQGNCSITGIHMRGDRASSAGIDIRADVGFGVLAVP